MKKTALLIDDSADSVRVLRAAFRSAGVANSISVVTSSSEAVDYWQGTGPFADRGRYPLPTVILLSLDLPDCDGFYFLEWIRKQQNGRTVLIIALVDRAHLKKVVRSYDLGADSFLVKPVIEPDLTNLTRSFPAYWTRA